MNSRNWMDVCGVVVVVMAGSITAASDVYHVKELSTTEITELDREKTAVILPGGILEQHGPHLPSFTDGYVNLNLTEKLAEAIAERDGWNALVFPIIPLGAGGANELGKKYVFPGTYAIRFETLRAVFMDLATELGEQGFKWIFVIHAHGAPNHNHALNQAGDYFHDTYGGEMVNLYGVRAPGGEDLRSEDEIAEDGMSIHAGMEETSRILHLQPELVKDTYRDLAPLRAESPGDIRQIAESDGWPGYIGSPRLASAEFGKQSWESTSDGLIDLALEILDGLSPRRLPRQADFMSMVPAFRAVNKAALERDAAIKRQQQEWLESNDLK